jgi:hypothetical protein
MLNELHTNAALGKYWPSIFNYKQPELTLVFEKKLNKIKIINLKIDLSL